MDEADNTYNGWLSDNNGSVIGNVTLDKDTYQSGSDPPTEGGAAWHEVNGQYSPWASDRSCAEPGIARSNSDMHAWWRVDLGAQHIVYNVTITNNEYRAG